jgi:hypothetical protein
MKAKHRAPRAHAIPAIEDHGLFRAISITLLGEGADANISAAARAIDYGSSDHTNSTARRNAGSALGGSTVGLFIVAIISRLVGHFGVPLCFQVKLRKQSSFQKGTASLLFLAAGCD